MATIRIIVYGLLVLLFAVALQYNATFQGSDDYLVQSQDTFVIGFVAILLMAGTIDLLTSGLKNKKSKLTISASILFAINIIAILDVLLTSWAIPGRCGRGFSNGNCLLLDGLGEVVYGFSVPALYIVGVLLLVANRYMQKNNMKKRVKKSRFWVGVSLASIMLLVVVELLSGHMASSQMFVARAEEGSVVLMRWISFIVFTLCIVALDKTQGWAKLAPITGIVMALIVFWSGYGLIVGLVMSGIAILLALGWLLIREKLKNSR